MNMQLKDLIIPLCGGLLGILGWAASESIQGFFKGIAADFKKLATSVELLNEKMATIVERVSSHEKRIDRLESKIED